MIEVDRGVLSWIEKKTKKKRVENSSKRIKWVEPKRKQKMKNWIVSLVLLCCAAHLPAQHVLIAEADEVYDQWRFYDAIDHYKKAFSKVRKKEQKLYALYRIADCYQLSWQYEKAEEWYKKAVLAGVPNEDVKLRLGETLLLNNKPEEAQKHLLEYKKLHPENQKVEVLLKSCDFRINMNENDRYSIENLEKINSKANDEFAILIGKKKNKIVFTSDRESATGNGNHGRTQFKSPDIFEVSQAGNSSWNVPQPIPELEDASVTTSHTEGAVSFNAKGNKMYFTRCPRIRKEVAGCQIHKAARQGKSWRVVEMLELAYDTFVVTQPFIAPDESYLLFVSNRPGGYGGGDIWYIKKEGRKWSDPINLGPEINTPFNEKSPYVLNNGRLIFASNGHPGMGGLDLFEAQPDGELNWTAPNNMGLPFNSVRDDLALTQFAEEGFLISSNREGGKGNTDIYQIKEKVVRITAEFTVEDIKTEVLLDSAHLLITDVLTGEIQTFDLKGVPLELNETSSFKLIKGHQYSMKASANNYLVANGLLEIDDGYENKHYVQKFKLDPIIIDKTIPLPAIYYDTDKASLRPESHDSLNVLLTLLKDNPKVKIKLFSYTDQRGEKAYNKKLSQERAQSCIDYLISKGIDAQRMIPVGKGEEDPVVEESEIVKLPTKEERDAAYQKNRRTNFSIIK